LIDFGLSVHLADENILFTKCGTPGFVAPEIYDQVQNASKIDYDTTSDIFSLGVVFYYM